MTPKGHRRLALSSYTTRGGPQTPFELYNPGGPQTRGQTERFRFLRARLQTHKPGDRRNVFRFRAVTPPPRGSAPVPETSPFSSAGPLGAPPADVPTPFPGASQSSRIPAGGRCACFGGLRRSPVRTPSPSGINATLLVSSAPTTGRCRQESPNRRPHGSARSTSESASHPRPSRLAPDSVRCSARPPKDGLRLAGTNSIDPARRVPRSPDGR